MLWSPKQGSFYAHSDAFFNLAEGAVRSGKTHTALARFAQFCQQGPPGDLAVFGKTERTVKRNVVNPLKEMLPGAVRYIQGSGELYVFGRLVWVIGASDIAAEEKVRGMTLAGGYLNEITLYPENIVNQTIARTLSIPGAKLFADCNPDSPMHYLNQKFITANHPKEYFKRWRFRLPDNPILKKAAIDMLKALYGEGSLFYRRMIDGEWVIAEGAVYQQWDERIHVVERMPGPPERVVIGVDYGTQNATVFLALGLVKGTWYVFAEYYHSGRESQRQKTDAEYSSDLLDFIGEIGYSPRAVVVDPAAASFKVQLRRDGISSVRDADNSVVEGIRVVSSALSRGKLKILKRVENLRAQIPSYVWDNKKQEKGEDAPMKGAGVKDDALDAWRYVAMYVLGPQPQRALRVVR